MKKRLLAWVLSFALALSLLPMGALAAEETRSWQEAYREYIQSDLEDTAGSGYLDGAKEITRYFLFDVNEDSVPELWIDYSTGAYGKRLCSYANGQVQVQNVAYGGLSYIPGQSLAFTSGGHMGYFWDTVYRLENGRFIVVEEGLIRIVDDHGHEVSENEYRYTWNNQDVDKSTYESKLDAAFDSLQAVNLLQDGGQTYQEILETLDISKIPAETLYKEILDKYKKGTDAKWTIDEFWDNELCYLCGYDPDEVGYAFIDIDGNGIRELLIGDTVEEPMYKGMIYDLYSYTGGSARQILLSAERDRYSLCEGSIIVNEGSSGVLNSIFDYYRFSGTILSLKERVLYDGYINKDNPYFYGTTENDEELVSITEERANEIRSSYVKKSIKYTSFAEYGTQTYYIIDIFSDYDPNTQQVTLAVESKEFPHRKYYVSEETDKSFINRVDELKGQPVAVRYEYSDYDTMYLLSIDPVEKVFGNLTSVSDTEVTIDGNTYPVSYAFNEDFFPEAYEGKYVLCYLQDGAAISLENMEQGGGTLESWSSATGKAKINGKEYTTSALSDLPDYMNQLVGKYVFFAARPLDGEPDALMKVTFQPGIYISSNAATTSSLAIGESMDLYVNYYREDGSEAPDLKGFYALPSDESVVTVFSAGWHEKYGQHFIVRAKKLGTTTISFGMTEPEARSLTMGLTVVPEKVVYRFDNVPEREYEEGKVTNFYNYNGMVINDFTYVPHKDAAGNVKNYTVTMTAYNSLNLYGAVTTYDADGTLEDFAIIDKLGTMPTGFIDSVEELVLETGDIFYLLGNDSYYSGESITKESTVSVEVPAGGYLVISNNTSSGLPALANLVGLVLETTSSAFDFGTGIGNLGDETTQKIIMNVVKNVVVDKATETLLDSATQEFKDPDWTMENYGEGIRAYMDQLSKVGINFTEALSNEVLSVTGVANITESVLLKFIPVYCVCQ